MKLTDKQNEAIRVMILQCHAALKGVLQKNQNEWTENFEEQYQLQRQAGFDDVKLQLPTLTNEENAAVWKEWKSQYAKIKSALTGE